MTSKDIVFLTETHANVKLIKNIDGFTLFGNPNIPTPVTHGGLAVFVKHSLAQHVKSLRYGKSSLSFIFPGIFFMGV